MMTRKQLTQTKHCSLTLQTGKAYIGQEREGLSSVILTSWFC